METNAIEKENTGYPSIDKPWMKYYDASLLNYDFPKMNIYDYLKSKISGYENYTAITYFGRKISYKQLFDYIDEAAKALYSLGVRAGSRIMYLMPNIPETAFLFYGGAKLGAVSDYIDPRPDSIDLTISAKKVLSLIQEEKPQYLIALDQCYLAMLKPVESELKSAGINQILVVSASNFMNGKAKLNYMLEKLSFGGFGALKSSLSKTKQIESVIQQAFNDSPVSLLNYTDFIHNGQNVELPDTVYQEDMLVAIVHSSGTSSPRPKPIPLTHDNLNAYVHQTYAANMPMKIGDCALHMMPYFAAYGLVDVLHAGLCYINNLIEIPEFDAADIGKIIVKHKPQIVIGVPTWFLSIIEDKSVNKENLSYLTMITYGGDSMNSSDEEKINKFLKAHGCTTVLTKGHGMSEVCGCASFATALYNPPGSIGIPMPYTTYAIVDIETKKLLRFSDKSEFLEGELIISSKAVTSGILDGKEIVPHVEYSGEDYIFTRDIARMDRNGIMTFLSRSNRSFTRYDGYKIRPYLIENILKECSDIEDCIISPYENKKKHGNMILATIVLRDSKVLSSREEQRDFVEKIIYDHFVKNPEVISYQIPSRFRFRKEMPFTVNGKLDYNAITNEGLCGDEICVDLDETAISIGKITIT